VRGRELLIANVELLIVKKVNNPAASPKKKRSPKPDILARLRADFGDIVIPDETFHDIRHEVRASPTGQK